MLAKHDVIHLYEQPLFTWVELTTPVEDAVPIPSEACFAYILEGDHQVLHQEANLYAIPGHVIMSLCGYTMKQMLTHQESGKMSSLIVHFHRSVLEKIYANAKPEGWEELKAPIVDYIVQEAASKLIVQYFDSIALLFANKVALSDEILTLKLKELILLLLQTERSSQVKELMNSVFSNREFTFKEKVDAHICKPFQLEHYAQLTNNSLSSFKREFKKIYNDTPGNYIMNRRVELVAKELVSTSQSISQIGYDCGFTSPAHLSRIFKKKYGVSPKEYRLNFLDK